jgi:hypothetical protein
LMEELPPFRSGTGHLIKRDLVAKVSAISFSGECRINVGPPVAHRLHV